MTNLEKGFGLADPEEAAFVGALQDRLAAEMPIDEMLDLAQLYYEPVHDMAAAVAICQVVLALNPEHERAAVLYAYGCIHHLMSPAALEEAKHLLMHIPWGEGTWFAASRYQLAEILGDLDADIESQIELLEESVRAAPGWVRNRKVLAGYLLRSGRREAAAAHLEQAIRNVEAATGEKSPVESSFDACFTGLGTPAERLTEALSRVRGEG